MRERMIAAQIERAPADEPAVGRRAARDGRIDVAAVERSLAGQLRAARAVKRLGDIGVATVGLVLTSPLVAVLAALVRADSGAPAFFRSPRMGRDQKPFTMFKLRTMDAAGRATRVGRVLRPLGLDELPQLWHVLGGTMSLIGPRPEVLDRVAGHQARLPHYPVRHLVRPGITGWAQVNGLRGEASSIRRRLAYDLEYIASWSLALDLRILLGTPAVVLRDLRRAWRR